MKPKEIKTFIKTENDIDSYGNIKVDVRYDEMKEAGYEFGDMLRIQFLDINITIPMVHSYKIGIIGEPQFVFLMERQNPRGFIGMLYLNSTVNTFHLGYQEEDIEKEGRWYFNKNIVFPIEVNISLEEKGGYNDIYEVRNLTRSNERMDYPLLSDDQFSNFRCVSTKGMGRNLYRGSSPISNRLKRNEYVDRSLEKHNIHNIINLTDSVSSLAENETYDKSYYSKQNILCLNMSVDMLSERYKKSIKKAIDFVIDNEPPYVVHCIEGQDRTGFFCGMLEFFMGASFEEVVEDYMVTFYNYYGVTKGDIRYPFFANDMVRVFEQNFYTEPITNIDLKRASTYYFMELGFEEYELEKLRERLM